MPKVEEVGKMLTSINGLSNTQIYKDASKAGITLTQYLERLDPSSEYGSGEKLDAFDRQMYRISQELQKDGQTPIITKSDPSRGFYASKVEAFYQTTDSIVLFPEWINRVARLSLIPDDVLNEIVGISTPIDGDAYRSFYVDYDNTKLSKKRIAQGGEIPFVEMKTHENTIKLYKYGRAIKATYEMIRRMRIDMLALHIQLIMKQAGLDRATDAYNVLINGDGNANTAAYNYNKTTLQGGGSGDVFGYTAWAKFLFNFFPYQMQTLIGGINELVTFLTMQAPNIDPLRLIEQLRFGQANSQGMMAQTIFNDYRIVYLPAALANILVGFDKRYSIEMVVEVGSDITEIDRLVTSQWQQIVISEVNGFAVFLPEARRTLTLNA
jgi:hypothetical protein